MVKFTFGFGSCGTVQMDDGDKLYYKNKVYLTADEGSQDDAITRLHTEVIPFECSYEKKTTISKVSYNPKSTLVITDAGTVSTFILKHFVLALAREIAQALPYLGGPSQVV